MKGTLFKLRNAWSKKARMAQDREAFVKAAAAGDAAGVEAFLANHGNTHVNDTSKGWPALVTAACEGHLNIVELLLDRGADIDQPNKEGTTALGLAAQQGHGNTVALLIQRGANVNAQNKQGETPLTWAAYKEYRGITDMLLDHGADPSLKNKMGNTALMCLEVDDKPLAAWLKKRIAGINAAKEAAEQARAMEAAVSSSLTLQAPVKIRRALKLKPSKRL